MPEYFIKTQFGLVKSELDLVPTPQEAAVLGHEELQGTPAVELENERILSWCDSDRFSLSNDIFDEAAHNLHREAWNAPEAHRGVVLTSPRLLPNDCLPDCLRKLLEHQGLSLLLRGALKPTKHEPEAALVLPPCGEGELALILGPEGAELLPE